MSIAYLPPEVLKKTVFDLVEECRENLKNGLLDVSKVEHSVRAYCEAISALPEAEGAKNRQDLEDLMILITKLGDELVIARDSVKKELNSLERIRKATVAYSSHD